MEIRGEQTWCAKCQAPEVWHDNVPLIDLYLDALPAWRMTGMEHAVEGLDRGEVLALMDLRGIAPADRAETWGALAELETETRRIRADHKRQGRN
jgi:hypothetical protein